MKFLIGLMKFPFWLLTRMLALLLLASAVLVLWSVMPAGTSAEVQARVLTPTATFLRRVADQLEGRDAAPAAQEQADGQQAVRQRGDGGDRGR